MTERASRENLLAASAELLFGAGEIEDIAAAQFIGGAEWQLVGAGFDFDETPLDFSGSEDAPSEVDDGQGALGFSGFSDAWILGDGSLDGSEAEAGGELIHPLEAEELDISVDVEAETGEAVPLDEETDSDDEDFLNSDDDEFALVTELVAEEVDSLEVQPEGPEGAKFVGTDGNDVQSGTSLTDELDGREGDDVLIGLAGKDYIIGYDGNDTLFGGSGDDELEGGNDEDIIYGGQGNDYLSGSSGNDTLIGGAGDDFYVWRRGDGDDLVIEEGQSGSNVFELAGVTSDQVRLQELENGDLQLVIASSTPDANDGGVITFQAGSISAFSAFQFYNPVPDMDWESSACT